MGGGGMYHVEIYARIRRACHVDGMSIREAAKRFGIHRKTVKKMLGFSVPPGYQRSQPIRYPKLENFKGIIDAILADDRLRHKKQRHTAKRILLRLQKQLASYKLLIIDELGFVPLSKTGAELLFEVFSQRYERGSILVTSNLPFDEWTEVFGSERLTGALLDR